MGLGLSGAYRAAGAQDALTKIREEATAEQQRQILNGLRMRDMAEQEAMGAAQRQRISAEMRPIAKEPRILSNMLGPDGKPVSLVVDPMDPTKTLGSLPQYLAPDKPVDPRILPGMVGADGKPASLIVDPHDPTKILGQLPQYQRPAAAAAGGQNSASSPVDAGTAALAEMVSKNPAMLQSMTPTQRGQVMRAMATTPALSDQYENTRMAPLRTSARNILAATDKLVDMKGGTPRLTAGAKNILGEWTPVSARGYIPGAAATDANAALQQVMGQQIVDLIAAMKSQSATGATGFGNMSEKELSVLEGAATQLTQRLSEPGALEQLMIVRDKLAKILGSGAAGGGVSAAPPAAGGVRQRPAGVPATATWDENRRIWVP